MIKAVIFDMDGVLIDAKEWHYEALNKALALFGFEISRYDHLVTYDGLPTSRKLKILSSEQGLPQRLHTYINMLKQDYTVMNIEMYCRPTFAHEFALSRLKAEGYKLAVATNSIRDTVDLMMKKSSLEQYLEFSLSNEDVKKAKPDPEIYITAVNKLGFLPHECVVVEDNQHGIQAAKAAKTNVLEVESVHDVTYDNITKYIKTVESEGRL